MENKMVRKFKKPSGYIVKFDSNCHSNEYLKSLQGKFEEVKSAKKVSKKISKNKNKD